METRASEHDPERAIGQAWAALAAGMLATGLHLPVSYALVKWACATDRRAVLILIAVVAFLITIAGAWLAWSCQSRLRAHADTRGAAPSDRSLFVAQTALGTDIVLALFIAASTIGPLVLSPCA